MAAAVSRRAFLRVAVVGLGSLVVACGGAVAPTTPPKTEAKPTEAAKPAAETKPTTAPAAAKPTEPAAAPTTAAKPAEATKPAVAAKAGNLTNVRVGFVPVMIYGPLFVAIEKGYFSELGLVSVPTPLAGGADIITQTVAGNFEVGLGGLGAAALNAAKRNLDFRIVASHHSESPPMTTPLVVAKKKKDDGTYKTVADLKGKKVSVNAPGTATMYWLNAALAKGSLTIKDIELVPLPFDQVAAALESGSLDGAMLGEPLVTLAEQKGLVVRLTEDFLTNAQGTVIFYNLKWAKAEAELGERWLAAWLRGARDLQDGGYGRDENAAIIEKYTKVPKDVVKVAKAPRHDPNGALNLDDMKLQQEFFLKTGSLTYTELIDLTTIIDTTFADKATARLGRR